MRSYILAAALAAAFGLQPSSAAAAANRVWVSGHGSDHAGCGAPTSPCRSLQYAHDHAVAGGGEIDILDPAGYGALTIIKSVSIVNDGVGTAGVQASSGNAITINAGPTDAVYLRGLNIDGLGTGSNGVQFNSGGTLIVANCVVRHFSSNGIQLLPSAALKINISASVSSDNNADGLFLGVTSGNPTVTAEIDHLTANDDDIGLEFQSTQSSGAVKVVMSDVIASNNSTHGAVFLGVNPNVFATIDSANLSLNAQDGLVIENGATVHINRSVMSQNGNDGLVNLVTTGGAFTTNNNDMTGNGNIAIFGGIQSEPLQ